VTELLLFAGMLAWQGLSRYSALLALATVVLELITAHKERLLG